MSNKELSSEISWRFHLNRLKLCLIFGNSVWSREKKKRKTNQNFFECCGIPFWVQKGFRVPYALIFWHYCTTNKNIWFIWYLVGDIIQRQWHNIWMHYLIRLFLVKEIGITPSSQIIGFSACCMIGYRITRNIG